MNPNTPQAPQVAGTPLPRPPVQPVQAAQPNYQEIMRQILSQLNQRKGTLFLRVLINLAPFILGFVILYAMSFFSGGEGEASESLNAAQ